MGRIHNKKRNVGIIFEQLVRYISLALVNKDSARALRGLGIIREHFKPESELYREFRLFNALVKMRVSNEGLANRILAEAKSASKKFNSQNLRHQKSALIKDINHKLDDRGFYLQHVNEYKNYATTQTLLNDWRHADKADLGRMMKYENKVCEWLLGEKPDLTHEPFNLAERDEVNHLTVKILTEKFNTKYGNILNVEQQDLIRKYIFSLTEPDTTRFANSLRLIKSNVLNELKRYSKNCNNEVLNEKISSVISRVNDLSLNNINDDLISRFLVISKLKEEFLEISNE